MRGWIVWSLALALVCASSPLAHAQGLPRTEWHGQGEWSRIYSRHAVAADHPLASQAGLEVLAQGGNAAEAAAAVMLALGVVSPASSGLGGGGFALYYRASDHSVTFLDFRERAPMAATASMFARQEGDTDAQAAERSRVEGLAVGVPGELAGIDALVSRFGSHRVEWADVVAPAERLAREGFAISEYVSRSTGMFTIEQRRDPVFAAWVDPNVLGRVPTGTMVTNPALAETLRAIARGGAREFYRGRLGRRIVDEVREHGGVMTRADLAAYTVVERAPLSAEHFGLRWVTAPPPSAGGFTMLQSLALLEQSGVPTREGAAFRHMLAESWIGAYSDRELYMGDPDFVSIPIDALLAPDRLIERGSRLVPWEARTIESLTMPLPGHGRAAAEQPVEGGTSHLCVIDSEGNIAAITTTVNLVFGARFTAAGIVMNDEMDDFAREVGEANAFGLSGGAPNLPGPGHRPVSTMSPTIVFGADGEPVMCVGASGGSRIVTAAQQVAIFNLLLGDTMGQAMSRPRVHHQGRPDVLTYERGMEDSLLAGLWMRGHALSPVDSSANVQAIRVMMRDGTRSLHAVSDPRKHGAPAGE